VIEVLNQHALKSSEENYRLLAENSTDMIARINHSGICTFISPASQDILGVPPQRIISHPLIDLIVEDDRTDWLKTLVSVHEQGTQATALLRFNHANNKFIWIEAVLKRMNETLSSGEIVINARDVTQRHAYQLAIEDLHQRNAKILDAAGEGVISLDVDGKVVYANERAGLILGRDPTRMVGETCLDAVRLLDQDGLVYPKDTCPLCMAMEMNETFQNPHGSIRHSDGRSIEVEYVSTPLVEHQQVAGCVVVFREATPLNRADHQGQTTDIILDQALEAVMVTDANSIITSINRAFTSITGYSKDEAIGATPKLLKSGIHTPKFYENLWTTLNNDGRWAGEIWNRRKNGEIYPQWGSITAVLDLQGNTQSYVAVFTDTSKAKQAEEKLLYLANHDTLTDLPNRLQFTDQLANIMERARRTKTKLAVLFFDLDRFKIINDTLGHPVGDIYLQQIANRLKLITRKLDLLARWGGDEFTLAVENVKNNSEIAETAQRVLTAISQPLLIDGHEFVPTASMGISVFPDDAEMINDLIKAADTAMYRAKDTGRNGFEFYTSRMSEKIKQKFDMAAELRRALHDNELRLHYQPQVDAQTGQLIGVEALVRWQHPERGLLAPAEFVPMAEDLGLMDELGDWVLREASRQVRAWIDAGVDIPRVAINVAPVQLEIDFIERIAKTLTDFDLPARLLEIEITEGALDQNHKVVQVLNGIRKLGVALSVDDFGTGYSSLSHIKHFPISCFKIDKSFIDGVPGNIQDVAITRTIAALGSSLSVQVIAEGVETDEQYQFLRSIGVDAIQGFYFGRPVTPDEIAERIRKEKSSIH
jgi:diguanylate cyclase (GGDEF)-like protein/PAS domain S-box-containing protein